MSDNKVDLKGLEKLPSNDDQNEINLKTTKVTARDKLFFESNNDIAQKQSFWKRNKRLCICLIILGILLIFLTRIPYIGSYPDAIIFEYLWGVTKYFIYAWGICLCIIGIFKPSFIRTLSKPKLIIMQILIVFGISLMSSAIAHWDNSDLASFAVKEGYFKSVMNHYHSNHFLEYLKAPAQVHYKFSKTTTWWMDTYYAVDGKIITFIGGGLFGEFFVGLGYLFVIIFALIIITFAVLSIVTSRSASAAMRVSKFFGGIFANKKNKLKFDELEVEKNDVEVDTVSSEEVQKEAEDSSTPPLRFLTDTSVDNYAINKSIAKNVADGMLQLGKMLNISIKHAGTVVMPLYTELSFKIGSKESIDLIIKNKVELSNLTKLKEFNILIKGNIFKLEYANKVASKISIKSVLGTNKVSANKGNLLIGSCQGEKGLFLNLYKQPSILIAGTKGSGASMLLSSMLATFAYLNKPDNKFAILAKNDNAVLSNFKNLPHTEFVAKVDYTTNNISDILKDFADDIDRRLDVYKSLEVEDFDEYNAYCRKVKQKTEGRRTLVFCDFNEVVSNNYEYTSLIQKILLNGYRCGIYIIIQTNFVNDEVLQAPIYQNINSKIILKLTNEQESFNVFENYRGVQLYGNGDGYIFGKSPDEKIRFQTCYLNQNELSHIIEIVNNFYNK